MRGHIRKRFHTTKDGRQTVNWYVVVDLPRDETGKRRQKWHGGFDTRKEAEAARAKIVHEVNLGTYVEPSSATLSQWVHEHWLPTIRTRVKPSTFDSYRRNLELHVLPRLGSRRLLQLTPTMLNAMYADLLRDGHRHAEGGLSVKTVRYIHTIVHKVLTDAVDTGLVAANVAARAKPPRPRATTPSEIGFWEPDELAPWSSCAHTGCGRTGNAETGEPTTRTRASSSVRRTGPRFTPTHSRRRSSVSSRGPIYRESGCTTSGILTPLSQSRREYRSK